MHTHAHTYIYIYTYVCTHIYICIYIYTSYIYIYIPTLAYTYTYSEVSRPFLRPFFVAVYYISLPCRRVRWPIPVVQVDLRLRPADCARCPALDGVRQGKGGQLAFLHRHSGMCRSACHSAFVCTVNMCHSPCQGEGGQLAFLHRPSCMCSGVCMCV